MKKTQTITIRPKPKSHQNEYEHIRNAQRMKDFNEKDSYAYVTLCQLYGPKPSHPELLSLAQVLSIHLHLFLDREAMRRKKVLIKWFDENFTTIEPFLKTSIVVFDQFGNVIGNNPLSTKKMC